MASFIFDIGKTNIKAYVLDESGNELWSRANENTSNDNPPYLHINVENIWQWLLQSLTLAAKEFTIDAINISTHGACAVLIDSQGELALPVIDYEAEVLNENVDDYLAIRPGFKHTLSPNLPSGLNLGRQLWWLKANYPQQFKQTSTLLMYPQYWAWKLSSIAATERTSLGCHTDLWQPQQDAYSRLVDALEIKALFPKLVDNYQPLGTVTEEISQLTGLPANCLVFPGVHDSNASLASHLFGRADSALTAVSSGTWIITLSTQAKLDNLNEQQDMLANVAVTAKPVACARFMGGREFDHICKVTQTDITKPLDVNDLQTTIISQQMVLPGFVPGCGPLPNRTGEIPQSAECGKALATLYTALMIDYELDLLAAQGDIYFGSTGHKNRLLCEVLAQLRPKESMFIANKTSGTVHGCWALTRWHKPIVTEGDYDAVVPAKLSGLDAYKARWRETLAI